MYLVASRPRSRHRQAGHPRQIQLPVCLTLPHSHPSISLARTTTPRQLPQRKHRQRNATLDKTLHSRPAFAAPIPPRDPEQSSSGVRRIQGKEPSINQPISEGRTDQDHPVFPRQNKTGQEERRGTWCPRPGASSSPSWCCWSRRRSDGSSLRSCARAGSGYVACLAPSPCFCRRGSWISTAPRRIIARVSLR